MEMVVYSQAKGRLETITVVMETENTTWFDDVSGSEGIASITDVGGSLLIKEESFNYPVLVAGASRRAINYDHRMARELVDRNE